MVTSHRYLCAALAGSLAVLLIACATQPKAEYTPPVSPPKTPVSRRPRAAMSSTTTTA